MLSQTKFYFFCIIFCVYRQIMADGSMKTLWVCSSNMGNQWVAVRDVYAWSNQDFTVSESFFSGLQCDNEMQC